MMQKLQQQSGYFNRGKQTVAGPLAGKDQPLKERGEWGAMRITLEPRIEANVQAQDIPSLGLGAGLADVEAGLRLRYALTPEIGPYIGVNHSRMVGGTADFARASGDAVRHTRFVVGLRA
jgi:hypothetical protein